jgi:transcriptional regulator with XRE-family HTH domain
MGAMGNTAGNLTGNTKDNSANHPLSLHQQMAARVHDLRRARGLSLDALAAHCGISRSMISLIERGKTSPTAVLLEKLAGGLNVSLASLFEVSQPATEPVARRADQLSWRDPQSGYVRRNVSPGGLGSPIQIVEVCFPPRARVAYETGARDALVHEQVWVLDGSIDITLGDRRFRLQTGDCLALVLDRPIVFHNPTRKSTRYAVVIVTEAVHRR